ncbi:Ribbon-helix-helix protein CopG domain-containing protein [Deinococcus saxicola]|uniref:ribbon-helix-helix domain-containing protein n=1 Tax=Deinococcus saxicola TaxID=249406 RepID=UPI0039EEA304
MSSQQVTIRLDTALVGQLDKIAQANKITRTDVIEELLMHQLEHQDEELASTFLLPRVEQVLIGLFDKHLWSLRTLLIQATVESTVASRLGLLKFAADNGYTKDQLSELRNQTYRLSVNRVKKKGVTEEEMIDAE